MQLRAFLKQMTADDRADFALRCETTVGHLKNVMYGVRPCAPDLAVSIERESCKAVTRKNDLRPKDWWRYWPELAGPGGMPPRPAHIEPAHAVGAGGETRPPGRRNRDRPGDIVERRQPKRPQEHPDPRRAPRTTRAGRS